MRGGGWAWERGYQSAVKAFSIFQLPIESMRMECACAQSSCSRSRFLFPFPLSAFSSCPAQIPALFTHYLFFHQNLLLKIHLLNHLLVVCNRRTAVVLQSLARKFVYGRWPNATWCLGLWLLLLAHRKGLVLTDQVEGFHPFSQQYESIYWPGDFPYL